MKNDDFLMNNDECSPTFNDIEDDDDETDLRGAFEACDEVRGFMR